MFKNKNQRKDVRSAVERAASYGMDESNEQKDAFIQNMSKGGFAFTSKETLPIGETITLSVEIDNRKNLPINVKVVWTQENFETEDFTIGVEILDKSGKNYDKFINFLTSETQ